MFAITVKTFILRLPSLSKVGKVHSWLNGRWRHCVCARGKSPRNTSTHLRKLEKAAMVAFMEMPMSAMAKLKTRKLLGVLSSLTLRKAAMVTAFKKKPIRPLKCGGAGGHTHDDNCHSGGGDKRLRTEEKTNKQTNTRTVIVEYEEMHGWAATGLFRWPPSRRKKTHPRPSDTIPGRRRQTRRSPPVKDTTRPSSEPICQQLITRTKAKTHAHPRTLSPPLRPTVYAAPRPWLEGAGFLKGHFTWKARRRLCKATTPARVVSPQSAQECLKTAQLFRLKRICPSAAGSKASQLVTQRGSLCVCACWRRGCPRKEADWRRCQTASPSKSRDAHNRCPLTAPFSHSATKTNKMWRILLLSISNLLYINT